MKKCYYCEKTEDLQECQIQVAGEMFYADLCPEHYQERQRHLEMIRQNYVAQFGENWH